MTVPPLEIDSGESSDDKDEDEVEGSIRTIVMIVKRVSLLASSYA